MIVTFDVEHSATTALHARGTFLLIPRQLRRSGDKKLRSKHPFILCFPDLQLNSILPAEDRRSIASRLVHAGASTKAGDNYACTALVDMAFSHVVDEPLASWHLAAVAHYVMLSASTGQADTGIKNSRLT